MAKKKGVEECYLCGKPAENRDHIPPKGIFDNPRPANLITVPACNECNNASAIDDEYFRWFVTTASAENPVAVKLIDNRILPRFKRKPALLHQVLKGLRWVDIYSGDGIWIGQRPAFDFDRPRIQRIVEKIVAGLYLHHCGQRLNENYYIRDFILNPQPPNKEIVNAVMSLPFEAVGKGEVFCYHYWKDSEDNNITGWFLCFFTKTLILAFTDLRGRNREIGNDGKNTEN